MRPIDADALLKHKCDCYDANGHLLYAVPTGYILTAPTIGGWISVKDAANIIAELFGDDCACNFNGIDGWLPQYCEHAATDCPHTAGTTCWEQYIKYLNKKPDIGMKEGERNGKL